MCPRPQAGSRHVIELRVLLPTTTCSMRARVAHGGVGKSSRLFFSSALCAITACDVFCIVHSVTCWFWFYICSICADSAYFDNGLIRKRPREISDGSQQAVRSIGEEDEETSALIAPTPA